jgi:hypothetical protein
MTTTTSGRALEKSIRSQFQDMRDDLNRKHEENRESWALNTRMTALETQMTSIIGDNSGGSGLLHKIDEKVDTLQSEFAGIKKVLVFLAVVLPIIVGVLGLIFMLIKH